MRKPLALKPGSHVRIVSPASSLTPAKVAAGVMLLESDGYRVSHGDHVFDQHSYLAGTDAERAGDLMAAFLDPEVDGVICSRGGYGCARLFPYLNLDEMAESGKFFAGFSDITTLHLALNRRGLVTFHTPMMITLSVDRESWVIESFRRTLRGDVRIPDDAYRGECINPGVAEGVVTGGCLCLLTDSIRTPDPLDCEGKIVLIEDVDENPHRVDAMLTHLINCGEIQKAAGIAVGEMTGTDERSDPTIGAWPWREIVLDRLAPLGLPMVVNFPFGHMKTMLSLPLGIRARLDAAQGTLEYLEESCVH